MTEELKRCDQVPLIDFLLHFLRLGTVGFDGPIVYEVPVERAATCVWPDAHLFPFPLDYVTKPAGRGERGELVSHLFRRPPAQTAAS